MDNPNLCSTNSIMRSIIGCLNKKTAVKLSSLAAYIAFCAAFQNQFGPFIAVFGLLPIVLISIVGGFWCGVLSGIIITLSNVLLFQYYDIYPLTAWNVVFSAVMLSTIGGVIGRLQDLSALLKTEVTSHKLMETAISKYEFIVNNTRDFMSFISRDYVYEAVNDAYCGAFNKKREDILGRKVSAIWGEVTFNNSIKPHLDACLKGKTVSYDDYFIFPALGHRYFNVSCYPFRNVEGLVTHAVVVTTDITERKIVEESIKANEQHFRVSLNTSSVTLFNQDTDLRYTWIYNPHPYFKAMDILGKTDFDLFTRKEDAVAMAAIKRAAIKSEKPQKQELKIQLGNELAFFDITALPLYDLSNNVIGVSCSSVDITKHKQLEEAIRNSEERFKQLFDNMRNCVFVYQPVKNGANFVIKDLNRSAEKLEKVNRDEIIGKEITTVFPYVRNFGLFDVFQKVNQTGSPAFHTASYYKDDRISGWRENYVFKLSTGEIVTVYDDISDKMNIQENLRKSEEKYKQLVEESPDPIFTIDNNGKFLFLNTLAAKYFNGTPGTLEGKCIHDIFPKEHADRQLSSIQKIIQSGKQEVVEELTVIQGREMWFSSNMQPIRDIGGKIHAVHIISRDITKIKAIQKELALKDKQQLAMLDNIPDIAWLKDKESRFIAVNGAFSKACGYSTEDLKGKNDLDVWPRDIAKNYIIDDLEVMRTRKRKRIEEPIVSKDGIITSFETIKTPIFDENGKVIGTTGIARDISERQKIQRALIESEEKYRKLFEESKDMNFTISTDDIIVDANSAAAQLLGYPSKESLLGKSFKFFFNDQEEINKIDAMIKTQGFVSNYEVAITRKDHSTLIGLLSAKLLVNKEGKPEILSGAVKDITDLRKLEHQLTQVQKLESIGILAGGIAHDFNNLLSGILGYSTMILKKTEKTDPLYEYAEIIETSARRASELTAQLLAFSQGTSYNLKAFYLNSVVGDANKLITRTFDKLIDIQVKLGKSKPKINGDAGQIYQVIMNLCLNARDAMPNGGKLTIETDVKNLKEDYAGTHPEAKPGKYAVLTLTDSGTGMPNEIKQRIFEPFFTTKEKGKGTGLGLSMVYGVIKSHGGFINVYSEPGLGSTFRIYLPHTDDEISEEILAPAKDLTGIETILVVDDEEMIRRLAKNILQESGYNVLTASNGPEALDIVKNHEKIDLVMLDMIMPKMNGHELYLKIKEIRPGIKSLLCSGYSQSGKAQEIMDSGVSDFVQKPYGMSDLLEKVRSVLSNKA